MHAAKGLWRALSCSGSEITVSAAITVNASELLGSACEGNLSSSPFSCRLPSVRENTAHVCSRRQRNETRTEV
ncbi:unnamed protein product [Musa hybrid cultivar]